MVRRDRQLNDEGEAGAPLHHTINDENKKLEACGDGLLLACARLYLKEHHPQIPYSLYTRLTSTLVRNRTLDRIAQGEGIHFGDRAADAFEREIARR